MLYFVTSATLPLPIQKLYSTVANAGVRYLMTNGIIKQLMTINTTLGPANFLSQKFTLSVSARSLSHNLLCTYKSSGIRISPSFLASTSFLISFCREKKWSGSNRKKVEKIFLHCWVDLSSRTFRFNFSF